MNRSARKPRRDGRRLKIANATPSPAYVVWELTLKCDHACSHCGSRAGRARKNELTTEEALDLAGQLTQLGAKEVALIGGEAYLHPGFLEVASSLNTSGVYVSMTTGGRGITEELAREMAAAGISFVSVSVDGRSENHDLMRSRRGSFADAMAALSNLQGAGIGIGANTNINRLNHPDLEELYEVLRGKGISAWQVQLTSPLGRAADRTELVFQPWQLLEVFPRIAALKERALEDGISLLPGNNLGYFGPEEALLRSLAKGGRECFAGCQAGRFVLGIESDGALKGCPSLQSEYIAGNVRESSLTSLWKNSRTLGFARHRKKSDLWGFCRSCPFADQCMGGCTFTAHSILGRPGNNPYCHFRARDFASRGLRERLVPRSSPEGRPFDCGEFEIVVEPFDAEVPRTESPEPLVEIRRPPSRADVNPEDERKRL